jgi:hypothetical protein
MMITTRHILLILTISLAFAACSAEPTIATGTHESALVCTPGELMCDYACYFVGGPSTNDCIDQCNASGTGWIKVQDCGWAQNLPYSSSCYEIEPDPICQWN